ncbi:Small subunit (SSU) processome component [Serendipita sp. 396]|nr:Small subunit (SSU) processome component [Serendipita sp. 396]KAG8828296.1 Small subunit (SSU) processome component [Serendipita sp. 401]KAG9058788.1 Small subunit (SSU) processome component [Serendipita sp. 407]
MESLIAQADQRGPFKKDSKDTERSQKLKKTQSTPVDATLASITMRTRTPKSLSNRVEDNVKAKKKAAKLGRYGYINDLKLRSHLSKMEEGKKDWEERMKDVQMLNVGESGGMEAEGELERTWKMTQQDIVNNVGMENARSRAEWKLDGGPYSCRYSRNGRHLAIAGRKGHVATFDWEAGKVHSELHLKEACRDITFLQDHTMFAVAQTKHVYMYDLNGVELHRLSSHIEPTRLEYLPYHFLLVSTAKTGFLKYLDITNGQTVVEHRTKLGPCRTMCQNPWNAVIQLGHLNGTVTLWTPNSPTAQVRLLAHLGEVTSVSVDPSSSGRYMATSGADGRVKIWDCRNWKGCLRQWAVRTNPSNGAVGAQLEWSQKGMLAVGSSSSINIFKQPVVVAPHSHLANPPLYMTHPTPRSYISSVRFIPHRDLLSIAHSATSTSAGNLAHEHTVSTILVPGSGNPDYDTGEGGDPHEGGKGRREREVRSLLERLEPGTIAIDPDMLGNMQEPSTVDETLVHRKQPRLQRLKATGKADEANSTQEDSAEAEDNEGAGEKKENSQSEKKGKKRMRGRDRSMKRYLAKKRRNVIDVATVAIRAKLANQQKEIRKAREMKEGNEIPKKSALDRFKTTR